MWALLDCNNFFVSCERVFRPDLWFRPCAVLSNNDGCIIARSAEVKKVGVPMGAPLFKYKRVLESIDCAVFSSNFALYADMSSRVMNLVRHYDDRAEVYSIDEVFFHPALSDLYKQDLTSELREFRDSIYKKVGIPVSIGVAKTKTLAKLANSIAKRSDGVFILDDSNIEDVLYQTDVGDIWGIGYRTKAKLRSDNIYRASTLIAKEDQWIRKRFGVTGLRTVWELRGICCSTDDSVDTFRKGIRCTRTLPKAVDSKEYIGSILASYVSVVAEKLRRQNSVCNKIGVYISTSRFKDNRYRGFREKGLELATASTTDLIKEALLLLDEVYRDNLLYNKVGVFVSDIISDKFLQTSLFDRENLYAGKNKAFMEGLDKINNRYGKGTVVSAKCPGFKNKKTLKPGNNRSPEYTTNWRQLRVVG